MRSGTGRKSVLLTKWAILAAALPFIQTHTATACYYHFAQGLPEPSGIWPTPADTSLTAPAQTAASAIAAVSTVDAIDDAAVTASLAPSGPALDSAPSIDSYVTGWMLNTTGVKGKSTDSTINATVSQINANIQQVRYTSSNVYVQCTGIPDYNVGPFPGNPNVPANTNATFEINRSPAPAATKTATGLGAIGVLVNGVEFFNMSDANSYNNQNVWHNNAGVVEAPSFDAAKAHPQQQGVYHNHENPVSLISELGGSSTKSVLLGFAIDGYPIYNDYAAVTPGGPILKMDSGYQLKTYANNVRGNGGPDVNSTVIVNGHPTTYVDGYFEEDFQYVANQTLPSSEFELDQYNGTTVYTSEFPSGTYAYFATVDAVGNPAYPYLVGPNYYGTPDTNDTPGHTITVPADATVYTVPEPATLSFLAIGILPLIRRKRNPN